MLEAERLFEAQWNDPAHTRVELPALDVNAALDERYVVSPPRRLTGALLWELEVRKARDPRKYIPSVVREASTFGHRTTPDGVETFVRVSEQRRWLSPDDYETVIERTAVNPKARTITFIGEAEAAPEGGPTVRAGGGQPLFSVQHGVAGGEAAPLNVWRIVHLTGGRDERIVRRFEGLLGPNGRDPVQSVGALRLPEYITIFMAQDLGLDVRPAAR